MKIKINNQEIYVEVAETTKDQKQGFQDVLHVPDKFGMLFIYDDEKDLSFWMKNTNIPLKIIGINDELEVTSVIIGKPLDKTLLHFKAMYVLEVNEDFEVKVGDEVDFIDDEECKSDMLVLDENGKVQMKLKGGERIFSRKNTKILIRLAIQAYKTKDEKDYKKLGNKLFKFLDIQDNNKPQYVNIKDK